MARRYVLRDSFGVLHAIIGVDFRNDRMCELTERPRSAFPGEYMQAEMVTCIACVAEEAAYLRVMRGLRGA
jgi:hypothetical protein